MRLALMTVVALGAARWAGAQRPDLAGQAILALTHVDPVPGGESLTELRLVQPILMVRSRAGPAWALLTLNAEGATIANGELVPGAWGEGFVDRRHPHTYLHEAMVGAALRRGPARAWLAAGKGFAPFGTDDPMTRPVLRYPVNHHLAQLLERAIVLAGAGAGPVVFEAAAFNGDEPERPGQWPNWDRFGDSWSARLTVRPAAHLELQGSRAHVRSPEHRPGAGTKQRKWSVAARWQQGTAGGGTYALVEWARSDEAAGFFTYRSLLAEAELRRGRTRVSARVERTERPEEVRTANAFRVVRPHLDDTIVGVTRWTIATLGASRRFSAFRGLSAEPVLEVSAATVRETSGAVFDPEAFYGRGSVWSVTLGVRVSGGLDGHRMGRYGVEGAH